MVTYLFGAGASFNAVPVVAELFVSFQEFRDKLVELQKSGFFVQIPDSIWMQSQVIHTSVIVERLINACNESIRQIKFHQTFDTYAKRLTITRDQAKLRELKLALTCYFYWKQSKKLPDNRYDHFLASIIDNIEPNNQRQEFWPNNIRILSWNYDLQFELSLKRYFPESYDFKRLLQRSRIITNHYPIDAGSENFMYKLNGTCLSNSFGDDRYLLPNTNPDQPENSEIHLVFEVAKFLVMNPPAVEQMFTFAWESPLYGNLKYVKDVLRMDLGKTETLVVIGYSFPFFNRKIDRTIIESMPGLENIYIQAPEQSISQIADRLKSIVDIEVNGIPVKPILVTDINQFFLPPDL